jgi:energy-coupling factor transport system permease protein
MKMRGINIGGRHASKIIEYRMVPLMTCCVNIGEELSAAALTRGLGGEVKRTNICRIGFHLQDYAALLLCLVPWVLLIVDVVR